MENTPDKKNNSAHFNVPFNSIGDWFIGRADKLEKIWSLLNEGKLTAIGQAININGLGGIGKTQLAVEYAHRYRDRYRNGVFWLTADEDIEIQLVQIAENLGWTNQFDMIGNKLEIAKENFLKVSECLIVFDNVENQSDILDYIPKSNKRTHILITSRNKQDGIVSISLDLLENDEAKELLLLTSGRNIKHKQESETIKRILDELDGLPLAIELVGGYLRWHPIVTFETYYKFLQEIPLNTLEAEFPNSSFTGHDRSIIRTLNISKNLFNSMPYLQAIFDILAWSGNHSMGISLLREMVETNNDFELINALGTALDLNLIKKDENAERYTIHRLLARIRRFEKPLEENREWHQKIVNRLIDWFNKQLFEFNYIAALENEIEHLETWLEQSYKIFELESAKLIYLKAHLLSYLSTNEKAKDYLEEATSLYQGDKLDKKELLGGIENNLGVLYGGVNNYQQALGYQLKSLELQQKLFGEKHPDIATSLNNIGSIYSELGNHQKALEYYQQALKIRLELFSENHPDIATSLNNIGSIYNDFGNYQKALEFQEQALKMRLELFGENHPDVANSLNNLGSIYNQLGNYQKALELQQQALEIRLELFGEKHPITINSLNNLGLTYNNLGNYQKALEFQQQALEMRRELLGERHPDTILSCINLIANLTKMGKIEQAGRLAGEFLSYVPQNHPKRWFFEEYGAAYRKARQKKKRHGK